MRLAFKILLVVLGISCLFGVVYFVLWLESFLNSVSHGVPYFVVSLLCMRDLCLRLLGILRIRSGLL